MMGLMVLAAFAVYVLLIIAVAAWGGRFARRRGWKTWHGALPAGLAMFFLIFQDYVPSRLWHAWQCNFGDAGFHVYKTIDKWREENPGVWETLRRDALPEEYFVGVRPALGGGQNRIYRLPDGTEVVASFSGGGKFSSASLKRPDGSKGYWVNQRFIALYEMTRGWFHVYRINDRFVDRQTGEVMARYVDYRSSVRLWSFGGLSSTTRSCPQEQGDEQWWDEGYSFGSYYDEISGRDKR
jgi:hypothetical protein